MLVNEFAVLGGVLSVTRGIDTLAVTGSRLAQACDEHGISLSGSHRALVDATATGRLLVRVADRCSPGAAMAAPAGLARTGRVRRREDVTPVRVPDPPLIVFFASRLPHVGVEANTLAYLELLGRAVSDLHLDAYERQILGQFADELGLDEAHVVQANRRYLNELIDAAVADAQVTDDEYDTLVRIASALDIDQRVVEERIRIFRTTTTSVSIQQGLTVVFTGDHPEYDRDSLVRLAVELGLIVQSGVSKSTQLVAAADPESNSGKAGKARQYGIPIIAASDLVNARLGDLIEAHGAGQVALKVITCPECHTTWTIPAIQTSPRLKRCLDCTAIVIRPTSPKRPPKGSTDMWAPPTIEWLTCETCGQNWPRQVSRGRKPRQCGNCAVSS